MKTLNLFIVTVLAVAVLSSCSTRLSYFTQDLYERERWSEEELKKIQFYVSQNIVLKRQLTEGSSEIVSGKIKIEDGREIEEIVIPKGTPGALVLNPKSDRLGISFEEGRDNRYLMFGHSPKNNDRYVLLASEWKRSGGEVTYDGKTYRVDSDDAFAALLVDLRKFSKTSHKQRVAKGRKID